MENTLGVPMAQQVPPTLPQSTRQPLPASGTLLRDAFAYSKNKLALSASILAIPIVLQAIQIFGAPYFHFAVALVVNIASFAASLLAGFALMFVMTRRDVEIASPMQAFDLSKSYIMPSIWVSILMVLAILGGALLLIVPGVILAGLLVFGQFSLFIEGKRSLKALISSWRYVRGYWWAVYGRLLLFMVVMGGISLVGIVGISIVSILGALLTAGHGTKVIAGIVSLVWTFLLWVYLIPAGYVYYADIFQALRYIKQNEAVSEVEEKRRRWQLVILSMLGVVAIILLFVVFGFLVAYLVSHGRYTPYPLLNNKSGPLGMFMAIPGMQGQTFASLAQLFQLYK